MRRACIAIAMTLSWGCGLGIVGTAIGGSPDGGPDGSGDATYDRVNGDGDPIGDASDESVFPLPPPAAHATNALAFRAADNQYLTVATIQIPDDFTLEAWIKPATFGSEMSVISEDRQLANQTDDQFRLGLTAGGAAYFTMTDDGSSDHGLHTVAPYIVQSPSPVALGLWTHVAVTKVGAVFTLYLGGVLVATFNAAPALFVRTSKNIDFRIAARMGNGGAAQYFDGAIDDVRLFDVGRSIIEINTDKGIELDAAATDHLIGYWRFDEGGGITPHDDKKLHDFAMKGRDPTLPSWVTSDAF